MSWSAAVDQYLINVCDPGLWSINVWTNKDCVTMTTDTLTGSDTHTQTRDKHKKSVISQSLFFLFLWWWKCLGAELNMKLKVFLCLQETNQTTSSLSIFSCTLWEESLSHTLTHTHTHTHTHTQEGSDRWGHDLSSECSVRCVAPPTSSCFLWCHHTCFQGRRWVMISYCNWLWCNSSLKSKHTHLAQEADKYPECLGVGGITSAVWSTGASGESN